MGEIKRRVLRFGYRATTSTGAVEQGTLTADSLAAAERVLRGNRLFPLEIAEIRSGSSEEEHWPLAQLESEPEIQRLERLLEKLAATHSSGKVRKKTTPRDILRITNDLSVLLKARLPLDKALTILIESTPEGAIESILTDLLEAVKAGGSFSSALQRHPTVFSDLYVNMVKAGEASGRLDEALSDLAAYIERVGSIRRSVSAAMVYPAILFLVSVVSVTIMLGVVVPAFETLFDDMRNSLPILTRILLRVGDFVASNLILIVLAVASLLSIAIRWWGSYSGRSFLDRILLGAPFIGPVILKSEITSFTRTLGTLLSSRVPLLTSINLANQTMRSSALRAAVSDMGPSIKQGAKLSAALDQRVFGPVVIQMVKVGEEAGALDEMLLEVARILEANLEAELKGLLSILEPILILGMGVIIALIVTGLLMGLLSVNSLSF